MTKSRHITEAIRCMLWGRSAGRCEFCNKAVSFHPDTKETVNLAEAAHIIGFSKDGPRSEDELPEGLANDITNLMLLCGDCHKTIDKNRANYPTTVLRTMKEAHEHRIALVTGIGPNRQSHIVLYGANVGLHSSPLTYGKAAHAMLPDWQPADPSAIQLGMINSSFHDMTEQFWQIEDKQLQSMFDLQIRPRLASGTAQHLSVFGFAPQPLLMRFGFLLSDIPSAEVYQLHREPPDWRWQDHPDGCDYVVQEPVAAKGPPALILALSATIADDRARAILGAEASIWRITIPTPHNDFLKSRRQLQRFREVIRPLMNQIKLRHGENALLHVFPAAPLAIAVEFGRIIMPKADLSLRVYDENKKLGGFVRALDIDLRS